MQNAEVFWIEQQLGDAEFPAIFPLAALKGSCGPKLVGTAFVISANESYAIAVSVAHNFDGLMEAQQPARNSHPSALLDLFGCAQEISLEPGEVSALYRDGDGVWVANVDWVFEDKKRDLAIFKISTSDGSKPFRSQFSLREYTPIIGDEVMVMGYDMALDELPANETEINLSVSLKLICRTGNVSGYHPEGHIFVRGPCIETTIPVFGGMSGGPVFLKGDAGQNMYVVGAISSDPEVAIAQKHNPMHKGQSALTLLEFSEDSSDPNGRAFVTKMLSGNFNFSSAEGHTDTTLSILKDKTSEFFR